MHQSGLFPTEERRVEKPGFNRHTFHIFPTLGSGGNRAYITPGKLITYAIIKLWRNESQLKYTKTD